MLTEYQLQQYANKFLTENYNMKLVVPLKLNGRLKTTCGRFIYSRNRNNGKTTPKIVELNKFFFENNEPTVVLDVLRHELVHYALFMLGKPNSDGHPIFERELKRLGIVSQKTINKYDISSKPTKISIYQCVSCKTQFKRKRALKYDGKYHRCSCGGNLSSLGKKIVNS